MENTKGHKRSLLEAFNKSGQNYWKQVDMSEHGGHGGGGWNMASFLYGFIILLYFGVAAVFLWFFSSTQNVDRMKHRW